MLREFQHVKSESAGLRRRWFQGAGLDLIVWLDVMGLPEGFQLCYLDAWRREHALTWRPASGWTHARVDGGDSRPDKDMTPVLVPAGEVPWQKLRADFLRSTPELDGALREFVLARWPEGAV